MAKTLNPVELVIFGLVATSFGFSAYKLFNQKDGLGSNLLAPMASNPVSENRAPASTPLFSQVDFPCEAGKTVAVSASKVRINGPICAINGGEPSALSKASIVNSTNQFSATVFTDTGTGKFSTDYIPLNAERNSIRLEFSYKNGQSVSHEFTIQKQ
jgi:hypothetical protein